ncbi:MAG: RloB domain-containing protein [Fibrobacter sp.]|nr:RloB domain-containing protein [Fibrobacter sp.]
MARERKSNPRKMRPLFLVLCEGETEENYINFLRQNYRLPIKIIPKIIGSKISQKIINRYKNELAGSESSIKTFLMYDGDLPEVIENLKKCNGTLLISKPCIEIWFISHYKMFGEVEFSSNLCIKELKKIPEWENYKKAVLTSAQESALWSRRIDAVSNMESRKTDSKNYSDIFEFIKILEKEIQNNRYDSKKLSKTHQDHNRAAFASV